MFSKGVLFRGVSSRKKVWLNEVQHQKFLRLLMSCGICSAVIPPTPQKLAADPSFQVFSTLFTPDFNFHQLQLTTAGDTYIDMYLSDVLTDYCLHNNLILTVNGSKQWNAVFHNHYALRLLANELQFGELAIPLTQDYSEDSFVSPTEKSAVDLMSSCLSQLEARQSGPGKRDVAGTSFMHGLLPCGPSPLGWKFSHFIGAIHQVFGPAAAQNTLERIYRLREEKNVMDRASSFLMRVLQSYPALSVAESILAAQGLPVRYYGKTRVLGELQKEEPQDQTNHGRTVMHDEETICNTSQNEDRKEAIISSSASATPTSLTSNDSGMRCSQDVLSLNGFGSGGDTEKLKGEDASLDQLLEQLRSKGSKSGDISVVDGGEDSWSLSAEWRKRAATVGEGNDEKSFFTEPKEDLGWLSEEHQRKAQSSPAYSEAIDVSHHRSFADVYGDPEPINGRVVSRIKFKRPVRDPLFYDKLSDMRNGIPLDVEGMGSTEKFLSVLQKPHRRLFEVSMVIGQPADERIVGRAIGWKYTSARDAASKAFLAAMLHDFQHSYSSSAPADEQH